MPFSLWQLSRYSELLRTGRSRDRIPVRARSAPVQTGTEAPPVKWVPGFFTGAKRRERGVNHPPLSSAEDKERVELYPYSLSGPSWSVLG